AVAANPNRIAMWGSTAGATSAMLDELYGEGHRWWLSQPAATRAPLADAGRPLNDIAVLLPVTIETRFYPPDADHPGWRVKVRVTPDDISVNRHRPQPTGFELGRLRELRAARDAAAPGKGMDVFLGDHPAGKDLWHTLCDALTPARAAWLVTTFDEQDLDAVVVDDVHHPARVDGFPDRIEVWVVPAGGGAPQLIGAGKPVQRDGLIFDLPRDDAEAWWNAWPAAVELGVGIECDLPGEPEQIQTLYVTGLSDENPAQLFADKVASGQFAAVEPGTPTNTVHGDPAVDLATDPATWLAIVRQRLSNAGPFPPPEHSAPLTGKADALGLYPAPAYDHENLNRLVVGSLYAALWGHPLKDIWGLGRDAHPLALWMFRWVRPEGHLLPIRSGDLPYGIVPTTSLARWRLHPIEAGSPDVAAVEPALVAAMQVLRASLAERARERGTTVDADTRGLVTLVGRTPTADGYSYQPYIPARLMEALLASMPAAGFDAGQRARWEQALRDRWLPGSKVRGAEPQRYYVAAGPLRDIHMPLILPSVFPEVPPGHRLELGERVKRFIDLLDRLGRIRVPDEHNLFELLRGVLPDSLFFRLLLQASIHVRADAARADPAQAAAQPQLPDPGDGPRLQPELSNGR
ncbi:MAG TPA: hypothetical protein VF832_07210, partial [Longimicrobiales bacterium]